MWRLLRGSRTKCVLRAPGNKYDFEGCRFGRHVSGSRVSLVMAVSRVWQSSPPEKLDLFVFFYSKRCLLNCLSVDQNKDISIPFFEGFKTSTYTPYRQKAADSKDADGGVGEVSV